MAHVNNDAANFRGQEDALFVFPNVKLRHPGLLRSTQFHPILNGVRKSLFSYTGCSGKLCFSLSTEARRLHIAARDFQSSQRNASVLSLLLAGQFGQFCATNSAQCLRGRGS